MTENTKVTFCEDGKYRWTYSLNLFTNLTVFWLVWKVFIFIFLGIFIVVMIADAATYTDYFYTARFFTNLRYGIYFVVGITAFSLAGYLLYAAIMGGKYTVEFEMDEKGILHSQMPSQAKKAKKLGGATSMLGAVSGNFAAIGAGVNAQRSEMYSEFSKVRKIKCRRRKCLIKVNGLLSHNQVYAQTEDFDFVRDYIISHCENIKK